MAKIDFTRERTYGKSFDGVLKIQGHVSSVEELPLSAESGDIYLVGEDNALYIFNGEWKYIADGSSVISDDVDRIISLTQSEYDDLSEKDPKSLYIMADTGKMALGSSMVSGADGVGVQSVVQTTVSQEDGGTNVWTITLTNGQTSTLQVKNGNQGNSGYSGAAGELEVVNNLIDGGATSALSAEMGKTLNTNVSQLRSEVDEIEEGNYTMDAGERLLTLTKTSDCYASKTATAYVSNSNGWYVMWFKADRAMRIRYKLGIYASSGAAQIAFSTAQPAPGVAITVIVKEQAANSEGYLDVEKDTYVGSIGSSDGYIATIWEQLKEEKNYLKIVDSHDNHRVSSLSNTYFNGVRLVDTMTQQRFGRSTDTKIGNFTPVSATSGTITLSSADAACITGIVLLSCKMQDGTYRNIYFSAASSNVITKLYDFGQNIDCQNIVEMQSMHDSVQGAGGIHLSPYGYRSMAQVIYDDLQTKKPFSDVFVGGWTAQFCLGGTEYNDIRVRDADGNVVCTPTLDGILTGGQNECTMIYKANSPADGPYYRTYYYITQSSPNGGTATFRLNALYPFKGFLRVGCSRLPADAGAVNLIVKDFDGNTIGTKSVAQYADVYIFDLNGKYYQGVDVVVEMPDAVKSTIRIAEMTLHETYVATPQIRPLTSASSVALLGSSNTQYPPLNVAQELCPDDPDNVLVTLPDGTTGEGCGYLGKQLARLSGATIDNWGKSGEQTTYGLEKIQQIFAHKRYTHIILSLFANDLIAAVPMSKIVENIRMMVEYAKGQGCVPIVLMGYGASGSLSATTYGRMYDVLTQGLSSVFIYTSGEEHV